MPNPNPPYNLARGAADRTLELTPPFDFQGVTARAFPVKANMFLLESFCSSYLNIMPPEIAYFRVAVPYVYIIVLDYGKMAVEAANLGWIAQHEVAFAVPLEWYRKEGGRLVFQDWAFVSPFIYVDNTMSLTTGREVYGWPKVLARFAPEVNPWLTDPRSPQSVMRMNAMVIPKLYAGESQVPRTLMEIKHGAPPNFSQVPPDLENPYNPLVSIPNTMLSSLSLMQDALQVCRDLLPWFVNVATQPRGWVDRIGTSLRSLNPLDPNIHFNIMTLKQFRDAYYTDRICYQAMVLSRMGLESLNCAGMLGEIELMAGDLSGGYSIEIHRYAEHPIIEAFGLEVDQEWEVEDGTVATIKPVCPFWMDVDMNYGLGQPIC